MFHANLQAAALKHKTADLRFAVTGLKQNHTRTKIPLKSAINRQLYLSLLQQLVIRPTETSILGAQEKNSSQLQASKKKKKTWKLKQEIALSLEKTARGQRNVLHSLC